MTAERNRAHDLVLRHGRDTVSFQALEPDVEYWFDGDDAVVAYVETGSAWVAIGSPIAPHHRVAAVAQAFVVAARSAGRRPSFFAVETPWGDGFGSLKVGRQPEWDPSQWRSTLSSRRSLREQHRRARAKDVEVRRLEPHELTEDSPLRNSFDAMVEGWLSRRSMAPMQFVVRIEPRDFAEDRRMFVAERAGTPVGFLLAVPVCGRSGWFIEDILRDADAPNGTVELLIDAAMTQWAEESCRFVTLGMAPLSDVDAWPLRWARRLGTPLYDFEGLERFKQKITPERWAPVYVVYPNDRSAARTVLDVLQAFAGGSLLRFAWSTLRHRARDVVTLLAWLLVPWTLLLACAESRWFPAEWVRWSWVGWDVMLWIGLWSLRSRWRPKAARVVAALATLDFSMGVVQLVIWNASVASGALDWSFLTAALLAPMFAALLLYSSSFCRVR